MQNNQPLHVITDWIKDTQKNKETNSNTTYIGIIVPILGKNYSNFKVLDNGASLKYFLNNEEFKHIINALGYHHNRVELIQYLIVQGQKLYYCNNFRLHIIHSEIPIKDIKEAKKEAIYFETFDTLKKLLNGTINKLVPINDNFLHKVNDIEEEFNNYCPSLFIVKNTNKEKKSLETHHKTLGNPCEKQNLYTK